MTEVSKMLDDAYLDFTNKIECGCRTLPTLFLPIWETIKNRRAALKAYGTKESFNMYTVCYYAALDYNETIKSIGVDHAFSTIICVMGIEIESAKWYRIMAHHYLQQAMRKECGQWIATDYKPDIYCKCSVCGRRVTIGEKSNYCPDCGAKMDLED